MTHHQKELVKSSFAKAMPISQEISELFFSRLFEIGPRIRPLFKDELIEEQRRMIRILGIIVDSLDCMDEIVPALKKLGQKYAAYGVRDAHYDIVASALLWTLERGLGAEFTDEVRKAWIALHTMISDTLKKGAEEMHYVAY